MRLGADGSHLTYCSNIHPGETWAEVRANLERYFPAVRDRVAPGQPFGIGLRLSAQASRALSDPATLDEFRDFLQRNKLYVFTINGFPYGTFHGTRVKEDVYLPDWRDAERLRYTDELADLLAKLLPEGVEGSVSTVPGAFKPAMTGNNGSDVERIADNLLRHVAHLVELEKRSGKRVTLAIEPEPHCYLETVDESVGFFQRHLFSAQAVRRLGELAGLERQAASVALHDHLGLCLDLCHAAVEFEDPVACLQRLEKAGIRVHKMQISAGLRVRGTDAGGTDGAAPVRRSGLPAPGGGRRPERLAPLRRSARSAGDGERARQPTANGGCTSTCRFSSTTSAPFLRRASSSARCSTSIASIRFRRTSKSRPTPGTCCLRTCRPAAWNRPSRAS